MVEVFETIIIGGGAAGLSAGIYSSRYLLKTLILMGKEPGGETATAWTIENYPGIKKIDGYELYENMLDQAKAGGVVAKYEEAVKVWHDKNSHCFSVQTATDVYQSKTLILAFGSQRRHLGLPMEKELVGKGISYCSTCDAPVYRDKPVAIVGGGDSSVKGAMLSALYSPKVYLITRADKISPEPTNEKKLRELGDRVEIITQNEVKSFILKEGKFVGVKLARPYKGSVSLMVAGLLVEIGFQPRLDIPKMLGVKVDDKGYIHVDNSMRTNVDGVYAAGDACNAFGAFKQDVTAAASGAMAATTAYQDIGVHGGLSCQIHALPPMLQEPNAMKMILGTGESISGQYSPTRRNILRRKRITKKFKKTRSK